MNNCELIKEKNPVIHCITNYVTVNDCANMLLAAGASPVMADEPLEAREITAKSDGLYINIGTINEMTYRAMTEAGKEANLKNIPVVLDPVGVGISEYRLKAAMKLLNSIQVSCIRGNLAEIMALTGEKKIGHGVDSPDGLDNISLKERMEFALKAAKLYSSIVVISGETDIVTDGEVLYSVSNGLPYMKKVTGTGCMLSAVITAHLACADSDRLNAALNATCAMGICGEKAFAIKDKWLGNSSYKSLIIDCMSNITDKEITEKSKYEIQ